MLEEVEQAGPVIKKIQEAFSTNLDFKESWLSWAEHKDDSASRSNFGLFSIKSLFNFFILDTRR